MRIPSTTNVIFFLLVTRNPRSAEHHKDRSRKKIPKVDHPKRREARQAECLDGYSNVFQQIGVHCISIWHQVLSRLLLPYLILYLICSLYQSQISYRIRSDQTRYHIILYNTSNQIKSNIRINLNITYHISWHGMLYSTDIRSQYFWLGWEL